MILTYDEFINESEKKMLDTVEFKVPNGWRIVDEWESNDGPMCYVINDKNDTFHLDIDYAGKKGYSIGFNELGQFNIVDAPQRYQVNFLKSEAVNKEVAKMASFLDSYIKKQGT